MLSKIRGAVAIPFWLTLGLALVALLAGMALMDWAMSLGEPKDFGDW